jgi:acyl-[acyl-carrier-protein]-phospholipid O-acyltransferase/long-chain-fatty-acid--[acyl-carrier-protein] ligase
MDMKSQFSLLTSRRLLPIFVVQFLNAFNDNVFKNALIILITYKVAVDSGMDPKVLVTLAGGIFILPYLILSATAGTMADKYEKSALIKRIKCVEIVLMACAGVGFYLNDIYMLIAVLFFMGVQSTFFGPLKYSILPMHLKDKELIAGNAFVEMGTFLAILLGTIIGSLLILGEQGSMIISSLLIGIAVLGWWVSFTVPHAKPEAPNLHVSMNIFKDTWNIISHAKDNKVVFPAIIGISWFWLVGATMLGQFPLFAKHVIGGNEQVVTLYLAMFSIGIGFGSLLCNKLLKGKIKPTLVPIGCFGMSLFIFDAYMASGQVSPGLTLIGFSEYINGPFIYTRIMVDLLMVSVFAGIYIVPLYAILQAFSRKSHISRNVGACNIFNALFVVLSALIVSAMYGKGFEVRDVLLTLAGANILMILPLRKLKQKIPVK